MFKEKMKRKKKMNNRYYELLEELLQTVRENYLLRCINYHLKQPHLNKNGRYIVGLSQPGIGTTKWLLHRLVALVYIPNPENLPYVCHKDNVPTNNSVKNLYWGTQKDNMSQASRDGRMVNKLKGKCIKGTEIQRSYIPKLIGMGFTRKEVSEITGLVHQLISDYYIKYKNKYEK